MTSGEQVSVAIKHKDAKCDKKWTAPQLMAGNHAPNWKDKKGAVLRRLAIFEWSNMIQSRDPSLKKKIIAQELVAILLRCVALYRLACERFESKEFWEHVAPQSLKDSKALATQDASPLSTFLADGNDYYQCVFEPGSATTWENLEKAYSNHCRWVLKQDKPQRIGTDHYSLKAAGFLVKEHQVCKMCGCTSATADTCGKNKETNRSFETHGDHYHGGKNRRKKMVVENMLLKCIKLPAQGPP
jgi:phage/plasmid-associated DNA primase